MPKLKDIVERNDTKAGRAFDIFIQVLIVISLVTFSIETIPDLSISEKFNLRIVDAIVIIIFTIEYLLRVILADKPLKFIFSFYGIIDLLAILPFYITTGVDLRSIRIFRLLRIFRAFKVSKYTKALDHLRIAISSIKAELVLFGITAVFLLYIAAVGIYYFENAAQPEKFSSIIDSLWWSVTTITTVGYGDVYPITVGGKIFTFFILMIGLGIVAVPSGLLASALTKENLEEKSKKAKK